MDLGNYRTIMIGHVMSNIYASILDGEASIGAEAQGLRVGGQVGFKTNHLTYNHILTLRGIIEEARRKKQRVYCYFVDFRKAFDIVPCAQLIRRLQKMGYGQKVIWAVVALYERVKRRVHTGSS